MKNSIVKNLSVLLSFGLIVKALGLINKIIFTRLLTVEGLAYYTKMMPIAGLFLTVASFSLGPTITQLVSKNIAKRPYSNHDLMLQGFKTATITASLVSIVHLFLNYFICHYLLRMDILIKPFLFFLPLYYLASYTGVFKGYFHGHNKMDVYASGQLVEQIVRILLLYIFIKPMLEKSLIKGVTAAVISLSIGELSQNIYLMIRVLLFTKIKKTTNVKSDCKELIKTSLSLTSNRLIGAISGFLEPVIYTYAFLLTGMNKEIGDELYGVIYGYSIPIILTTSFITASIESAILPSLIQAYSNNEKNKFQEILKKALFLSFIPAALVSFFYFFYSYEMMEFVYHTTRGAYAIKVMAIPSFIGYFEGVFVSALLATKNEKRLVLNTILTNLLHLLLLFILVSNPKYNALGLVYSFSIVMILSTLMLLIFALYKTPYRMKLSSFLKAFILYASLLLLGNFYKRLGLNLWMTSFLCLSYFLAICFIYYKKYFTKPPA